MQCKQGDTVRFLNDVGGGVVVRLVGHNQVLVRDSDGFEIPVLMSEVVVVNSTNDTKASSEAVSTPKDSIPLEKKKKSISIGVIDEKKVDSRRPLTAEQNTPSYINRNSYNILLGFCPKQPAKPVDGGIELYLINDSTYHVFYTAGLLDEHGNINHFQGGELEPDSKVFLKVFGADELNTLSQLSFGLMLFREGRHELREPEQLGVALNPVKMLRPNAFEENDYFEEKAMLYKLLSSERKLSDFLLPSADEIATAMKDKKTTSTAATPKKLEVAIEEVDLHIEELTDNYVALSNAEILDIQLSRFTTALELGLRSGTKRMVFIHGVGNGKLKREILRLLDTQYAGKLRYQDASFKEYGYGATMVLL